MIIKCVIELIYMKHGVDNVADNRLVSISCQITLTSVYIYIVSVLSAAHGCPFLLQPTSLNTSEGSIVNFTAIVCSGSVYWAIIAIDNSIYIPGYQSVDLSVYQSTLANDSIRSDLVVTSLPKYNNAEITATVYTPQLTTSNKVFLKIQGNNIIIT